MSNPSSSYYTTLPPILSQQPRNDYPIPPPPSPQRLSNHHQDAFSRIQMQPVADITSSRTMPAPIPSPRAASSQRLPAFFGEITQLGTSPTDRRSSVISLMSVNTSKQSGGSRRGSVDEIPTLTLGPPPPVSPGSRRERQPSSGSKYEDALEVQPQSATSSGSPYNDAAEINAPSPNGSSSSSKSRSRHDRPSGSQADRSSKRPKSSHQPSSSEPGPSSVRTSNFVPSVLGSRNITDINPHGYTHPLYIPIPPQGPRITPPEQKHTPEELFHLLKGYKFDDKLASVGLKGPKNMAEAIKRAKMAEPHNKRDKVEIWTDDAEYAFLASELYLPPSVNSKVLFFQKPCGRNEIIALIITMVIGKLMTRKQVSSHLQVVRQRKNLHPVVKNVFDREAREMDTGLAPDLTVPSLSAIPAPLSRIIGIPLDCDLSQLQKPSWISELEYYHPGAEYKDQPKPKKRTPTSSKSPDTPPAVLSPPTEDRSARIRQGVQALPSNEIALVPRTHVDSRKRKASAVESYERDADADSDSSESESENEGARSHPSRSDSRRESRQDYRRSSSDQQFDPTVSSPSVFGQWTSTHPGPALPAPPPYVRPHLQLTYVEVRLANGARVNSMILDRDTRPSLREFNTIPLADVRFKGIRETSRKYYCPILHVEMSIDLDLVALDPREIVFEMGISGLREQAGATTLLLGSSSGYLEGCSGRPNVLLVSRLHGGYEKPIEGRQPTVAYRPDMTLSDNKLCSLLSTQRDAATTVLPYFWVLHEVFATRMAASTLVGSKIVDGRSCTPAAAVADDLAFIVLYSFTAGKRDVQPNSKVEQVYFG